MLEMLDTSEIISIVIFLMSIIVAVVGNYLKFMNEFNFIKGQLSQLLKQNENIGELSEKYGRMEQDFSITTKDIENVLIRIQNIEAKILGGFYGTDRN